MKHTFNFLNPVFQELKQENKENHSFVFLLLLLLTIPLGYAVGNIAFGLLIASIIYGFKKKKFHFHRGLFILVLFFGLMVLSLLWTIDCKLTSDALAKEIAFLVIPLVFMFFGSFSENQKTKVLKYYSYGMLFYGIFFLLKAILRYFFYGNPSVFFYHELVGFDLNAIHVSVYFSIAFFYFLTQPQKKRLDYVILCFFLGLLFLLSSKNILVVFTVLVLVYALLKLKGNRTKFFLLLGFILMAGILFSGKIKDRFEEEVITNIEKITNPSAIIKKPDGTNSIGIAEAWTKEEFSPNDYFSGTAFRVYQIRVFKELAEEDMPFYSGYGLNAFQSKIKEKARQYTVYPGYGAFNFHNQYIQSFAELGILGCIVLIGILFINLKNAFQSKDFVHFAFAILMISLFLTESFLARQRGILFFVTFYCIFNSLREHSKYQRQIT